MLNVEIKAIYPDLEKAHALARELGADYLGELLQEDTYFKVPNGRFKLRESSDGKNQLIPYLRPCQKTPKESQYHLIEIEADGVSQVKKLFSSILGVDQVVRKRRDVYLVRNIRIHLDRVENLGNYLELEAVFDQKSGERENIRDLSANLEVAELMTQLEVSSQALVSESYRELLMKK